MTTNPSILVTGGAGLIGSAVVKSLNDQGITDITIVDRLGKIDKWRNLAGLRYRQYIEVEQFDIKNQTQSWQVVFHLGACSSTTQDDATYLINNNYQFSIDLMLHTLKRGHRFIYASSAATYGNGSNGMSDECGLDTLRPLNGYGYSKHLFDLYVRNHGYLNRVTGLKYFNVFGPGENHKGNMRSVVSKGYDELKSNGRMTLFRMPEDKTVGRDFLYVKDAAAITTWLALTELGRLAYGLFNVGSGVASTWEELVRPAFAALNKPVSIQYVPIPDHLKGRYQYYTKADISRLRAAGYAAPITPLSDAVQDYVARYLETDKRLAD